ncbi:hypothetical protein TGCAST_389590 [Toxoplasma gondii CAST]|uniref:Transmembrane protein n=1 Tax=Toxoplasma gondii CAST TaxID=943122 RepID=A0A3R8A4J4_TOXGO|nr:hypothetical protein TGCAST_389590 [Toxoplasma gondii CAST]
MAFFSTRRVVAFALFVGLSASVDAAPTVAEDLSVDSFLAKDVSGEEGYVDAVSHVDAEDEVGGWDDKDKHDDKDKRDHKDKHDDKPKHHPPPPKTLPLRGGLQQRQPTDPRRSTFHLLQ